MTSRDRTVAILQARMGSTRLPGKVLLDLGGRPVIAHCIDRAQQVAGVDLVCVATSDQPADDRIAEFVGSARSASLFRGSPEDVLGRYLAAARETRADVVLRITCDCPLIDPAVTARVVRARSESGADYATNNMPPSFPHGLDCEVFTRGTLERAAARAADAFDREHVTPWMRRDLDVRRVNVACDRPGLARERWTLDYPEDLAFLRAVFERLPAGLSGAMDEVLQVLDAAPALRRINAARVAQHA